MDPYYIWACICSILAAVSASETRPKRDLNLLQNFISGISGANTRKCRYKNLMPEFRSYNLENEPPQHVNLFNNYKISEPNFPQRIVIQHPNDRNKDILIINDNTELGRHASKRLCLCEEKETNEKLFNFRRVQKVNRNNPFYHKNHLTNTNLQQHYNNFGITPNPFYKKTLQKVTEVNVKRPVNMIPFYSFKRYLSRQSTKDNTANVTAYQQKYSYKQTQGNSIITYEVDKNGNVQVTQADKSLEVPSDKQQMHSYKHSLDTNTNTYTVDRNGDVLTRTTAYTKTSLPSTVQNESDHFDTGLKTNSINYSHNVLNSDSVQGNSQQKYVYKQSLPDVTKSYTIDKNGAVMITEINSLSPQATGNMKNSLEKYKSIPGTNNAMNKNLLAESTSRFLYQNTKQSINGEPENNENVVFAKPITSRYTYKQINHSQPNKFTVVKVVSPQKKAFDMTNFNKNTEVLLSNRKNYNIKETEIHNVFSLHNKETGSVQNKILNNNSSSTSGYVYIPPYPNSTAKGKKEYPKNAYLNHEIHEDIYTNEIQEESDSSNKSFVNFSKNPIIVKESPSYKYTQAMGETLTVIKANEGKVVATTINKRKDDLISEASQNNDNRGDVPEY